MQNGSLQVKDLFNGDRIFNVPRYQRAYTWEKGNLEDFLDDLNNQRDLEKNYFLGTFLFHRKDDKQGYEYIDIVDGQQRLTTIVIFLKLILELLQNNDSQLVNIRTYKKYIYDDECFKLELENEDNSFLHKFILSDFKNPECETPSQKKLVFAKEFLKKSLQKLSLETLERIYSVLTEAKIIIYIVNEISDATQIFELLNDRGKRLTTLEGIKSFLMYKIGCLNISNKTQPINDIQSNFSSIYRLVEKFGINEDDVLRYHTIAFEDCKTDDYNSPNKYIKNKINSMFDQKIGDLIIKDTIIDYVNRLQNSFNLYKNIKINTMKSKGLDKLFMVGRVNPFIPLIMHVFEKESPEKKEWFVESIYRFTFKSSLIGLRNDNESFYSYIRKKECFQNLFQIIIRENWWNINERVKNAINYVNYYEWINKTAIKYILFSYENKIRLDKGYPLLTREDYFSEDSRMKLNIEHITAQRAENIILDEKFKTEYLHNIGNLVIDTTASNSRKGNKGGDEKKEDFLSSSLMSQSEITDFDVNWDDIKSIQDFIEKRAEKIREFIVKELL